MSGLGEAVTAATPAAVAVPQPALAAVAGHARVYAGALYRDKLTFAGSLFLLVLVITAIFAPVVAPFDPKAQSLFMRTMPLLTMPEAGGSVPHLLGTDFLGRDVLSRLIYASRISLAAAWST